MKNKYAVGKRGQEIAEDFLRKKGGKILERNYRVRTGEIDLIVHLGEYVVFVEVKFRSGISYGLPREAVGGAKQQKIIRTAMHYISARKLDNQDFRFDVVEVLEQGGRVFVNHIEDAFGV